ncbi:RNA-binding domain-containing protein [Aquaticitalea lipolytica]|uniref:RNA-binding domain-containing protein n=1 Tax=Aquaticitalea lipolytica TaxID=1247562 RepID=UPI0024BB8C9B|nr:RNA-binding domain-containing protein [Aquaticitalea lipolytica]
MSNERLIKDLIKQGQGEQLEFKTVVHKESIAKDICAFLNADGGRVIVGVSDNQMPVGLENAKQYIDELHKYLIENIIPDAPISISVETLGYKEILVIKVWGGSKQPYIFDGSIFYRKKNKTQKATSKEISILIHDRQLSELHWERQIALGVDFDDLDKKLISKTIKESRKNHRSSFESDDLLAFLTHYGLYVNGSFTNACVVLFAKKPSKFIPQIRVRLTEYAEGKTDESLIRNEILEGNIFSIRDELERYVNGLGVRSVFDKNQWKRLDFTFPKRALQEGIINALIHRDYSSFSSSVTISVYPNKFVISNSGRLPDNIEVKDLKKNHDSHPVNPDIAHIVFLNGLIDKLGRGTIRVIEECKDAGLKVPEWKETVSSVVLTFNGPKGLSEMKERNDAVNDVVSDAVSDAVKQFVSDAVSDAVNDAASDAVISRLIQEVFFLLVEEGKGLKDLMSTFDVARATMQRDMALLKAHQFIVFKGPSKTGVYSLTDKFKEKIEKI